jgi:hypothetical protein
MDNPATVEPFMKQSSFRRDSLSKAFMTLLPLLCLAITAAAQTTGNIVVYRPGKFIGRHQHPKVFCDGLPIAKIGNGRRVTVAAAAGHHLCSSEGGNVIPVNISAGSAAYLRMVVFETWHDKLQGRPTPTLYISSAEEEQAVSKLKPLEAKWILRGQLPAADFKHWYWLENNTTKKASISLWWATSLPQRLGVWSTSQAQCRTSAMMTRHHAHPKPFWRWWVPVEPPNDLCTDSIDFSATGKRKRLSTERDISDVQE